MKVIGRLPGETSCLSLVWAVLDRASRGWRGFTMTSDATRHSTTYAAHCSNHPPNSGPEHHPADTDEPTDTVGAVA